MDGGKGGRKEGCEGVSVVDWVVFIRVRLGLLHEDWEEEWRERKNGWMDGWICALHVLYAMSTIF